MAFTVKLNAILKHDVSEECLGYVQTNKHKVKSLLLIHLAATYTQLITV